MRNHWRRVRRRLAMVTVGLASMAVSATAQNIRQDQVRPAGEETGWYVEVPAEWGTQTVTYETRGISRQTFRHRALPIDYNCPGGRTCFTAYVTPDDRLAAGRHPVDLVATDAGGRTRTLRATLEVLAATDTDGDGLPDVWERSFLLDPSSASGNNGRNGDPDGDGRTNIEELRAGTMPTGRYLAWFGESSSGDRQGMQPCFWTTFSNHHAGSVRMRLIGDDGREAFVTMQSDAFGACPMDLHRQFVADRVVAVEVESSEPVIVDRRMVGMGTTYWSGRLSPGPATEWHYAHGVSGTLDTFLLAYNPQDEPVSATYTYYRSSDEPPIVSTRTLAPRSRTTVWVDADEPHLGGEYALTVRSSAPILLDRGLRWQPPGRTVPQESASAGVTQPAVRWFFPQVEGSSQPGWSESTERLVFANPGTAPATLEISAFFADREPRVSYLVVGPMSRTTVRAADVAGDAIAGVRVFATNGTPIVAELAQDGLRDGGARWEFSAPGADGDAVQWGLAGNFGTTIVLNPSDADVEVKIDGVARFATPREQGLQLTIPARRYRSIRVHDPYVRAIVEIPDGLADIRVTSLGGRDGAPATPIVVGRESAAGPGAQEYRPDHIVGTPIR